MLAHGLMKCSKQLRDEMATWLKKPFIQLSDKSSMKIHRPFREAAFGRNAGHRRAPKMHHEHQPLLDGKKSLAVWLQTLQ